MSEISISDGSNAIARTKFTIKNPTNESFRVYFDLYINRSGIVKERPQMFADLGPYEVQTLVDSVFIGNLQPGEYSAQVVGYVGNFEISKTEDFEIVQ